MFANEDNKLLLKPFLFQIDINFSLRTAIDRSLSGIQVIKIENVIYVCTIQANVSEFIFFLHHINICTEIDFNKKVEIVNNTQI